MTNDESNPKPECRRRRGPGSDFGLRASFGFRHLDFVIVHSLLTSAATRGMGASAPQARGSESAGCQNRLYFLIRRLWKTLVIAPHRVEIRVNHERHHCVGD